jgi:hypothetical protein
VAVVVAGSVIAAVHVHGNATVDVIVLGTTLFDHVNAGVT